MSAMTTEQKKSYPAVKRYVDCMQPVVAAAKRSKEMTDERLHHLGEACSTELGEAANEKAMRRDIETDNADYRRMTFDRKVSFHRADLNDIFWCDVRERAPECQRTD